MVRNIWSPDSLFATIVPSTNALQMISTMSGSKVQQPAPEKVGDHAKLSGEGAELPVRWTFSADAAFHAAAHHVLGACECRDAKPVLGWANLSFHHIDHAVYHYNGYLILPLAGLTRLSRSTCNILH